MNVDLLEHGLRLPGLYLIETAVRCAAQPENLIPLLAAGREDAAVVITAWWSHIVVAAFLMGLWLLVCSRKTLFSLSSLLVILATLALGHYYTLNILKSDSCIHEIIFTLVILLIDHAVFAFAVVFQARQNITHPLATLTKPNVIMLGPLSNFAVLTLSHVGVARSFWLLGLLRLVQAAFLWKFCLHAIAVELINEIGDMALKSVEAVVQDWRSPIALMKRFCTTFSKPATIYMFWVISFTLEFIVKAKETNIIYHGPLLFTLEALCRVIQSPVSFVATSLAFGLNFYASIRLSGTSLITITEEMIDSLENETGLEVSILFLAIGLTDDFLGKDLASRTFDMKVMMVAMAVMFYQKLISFNRHIVNNLIENQNPNDGLFITASLFGQFLMVFAIAFMPIVSYVEADDRDGLWAFALRHSCGVAMIKSIVSFGSVMISVGYPRKIEDFVFYSEAGIYLLSLVLPAFQTSKVFDQESLRMKHFIPLTFYCYTNLSEGFGKLIYEGTGRMRTASLMSLLPSATRRQVSNYADICAICRAALAHPEARATPCLHLFHGSCLESWLKRSDLCPLCNANILIGLGIQKQEMEDETVTEEEDVVEIN